MVGDPNSAPLPANAPLPSGPVYNYAAAYGGIPSVPNPSATQGAAVGGNIGNLGGLYSLAGQTNTFNQQQAAGGLRANLPGYASTLSQLATNAGQQAQGQVPQDVVNQEAQFAAERGIRGGYGANSPNGNAALLAALGRTSIQQQQLGQQNFGNLVAQTPQAPIFDPSKFFVTPEQQQAAQTASNVYGSAPIPQYAANAAMNALRNGLGQGRAAATPFSAPPSITDNSGPAPWRTAAWNAFYGQQGGARGNPASPSNLSATSWSGVPEGAPPTDTSFNPVTNTSNYDPFMGMGSFYGGGQGAGSVATNPSVGDLFGGLSPEDLDYFG